MHLAWPCPAPLCTLALPGTLLPTSFVHQSTLLGAVEEDSSSWNDPPSPWWISIPGFRGAISCHQIPA